MSRFEDDLGKTRKSIEDSVKMFSEFIKAQLAKISEVEGKLGVKRSSEDLWNDLKNLRELKQQVKEERIRVKEAVSNELKRIRERLEISKEEGMDVDMLKDEFEDLSDFFGDVMDDVGDYLEDFLDRVEEVEDKIRSEIREKVREKTRELKEPRAYIMSLNVPEVKAPEIKIPDIGKLIEESLSKAWSGVPSMIVSSVRLPRVDLDLIDALVEAGIFKSRNEGIAFFAHKGIEASSDWLNRVREKLEEIKRLQEETKKEMEKMLGEETKLEEKKREEEGYRD